MFYESYGIGGWLKWGALLSPRIASPLLCANALMAGRSLPTFLELLGPREIRTRSVLTILLGLVLAITALIAAETALGFVFDPRYRDFPYASLTMAVVPFMGLMVLNRPQAGARPIAEAVFAGLLGDGRGLCRHQRGPRQLAVDVDLRDVSAACAYAVAGAGRAKPRISRPIAIPDSAML